MSGKKRATTRAVSSEVGIRELNGRLSEFIAAVRGGAEVTVTSHGKPVAMLVPVSREDPLERLRRQGLLIEPSSPPVSLGELEPIAVEGSVSELVIEQRR